MPADASYSQPVRPRQGKKWTDTLPHDAAPDLRHAMEMLDSGKWTLHVLGDYYLILDSTGRLLQASPEPAQAQRCGRRSRRLPRSVFTSRRATP